MEERTVQRKGRRVRQRKRHWRHIGGIFLILLLAAALIGATQGTMPKAPPSPTEIDHLPVTADVLPGNQQSPTSAEADSDWYLTLVL